MPGWTTCGEIMKRDSPEEPGLLGVWTCTVIGVEGDDITVIYCDQKKGTAKKNQFLLKPVPGMVTIANNVQPESDYFTDGDDEDDPDDTSDYAAERYGREDDDVQPSAEGSQAPGPKEKRKKGKKKSAKDTRRPNSDDEKDRNTKRDRTATGDSPAPRKKRGRLSRWSTKCSWFSNWNPATKQRRTI